MVVTRRRLIASGIATTLAGGAALIASTDSVSAKVEMQALDVPDSTYRSEDGTPHAPHVILRARYSYDVSGIDDRHPDEWLAYLEIGNGNGDFEQVGMARGDAEVIADSGDLQVRADLTESQYYASEDFHATDNGGETSVMLPIRLVFVVRDLYAERIVTAEATDTATLRTVNKPSGDTITAGLNATGAVRWQANESDPTPTLTIDE